MSSLDRYKQRLSYLKDPPRERWLKNTQSWIRSKLPHSLSYYTAIVDGEERQCAIISTQKMTEKKIYSLPNESFFAGAYVEWENSTWLITSVDEQNEVYQTGLMVQCNYNLKWVNPSGEIISRMVIAIDGTKYLTGEYSQQFLTAGDARMQITMPKDSETVLIGRGDRFLIDDPDAQAIQAFEVTKLNRASSTYNGHGVYIHMLVESPRDDSVDNYDLMVANYYDRIKPVEEQVEPANYIEITSLDDSSDIYIGTNIALTASVYINNELSLESVTFSLDCDASVAEIVTSGEKAILHISKDRRNAGKKITLTAACDGISCAEELTIRGWS